MFLGSVVIDITANPKKKISLIISSSLKLNRDAEKEELIWKKIGADEQKEEKEINLGQTSLNE